MFDLKGFETMMFRVVVAPHTNAVMLASRTYIGAYMSDLTFFENEAILDLMAQAIKTVGFNKQDYSASDLAKSIPPTVADRINDEIVNLLADPSIDHLVTVIPQQTMPSPSVGYGWRLRSTYHDGRPASLSFYRVSQSWVSTALSLAGLSMGLYMMSPGAVLSAIALVRNTWQNLITLSRPNDSLAIDAYEALLKAELEIAANSTNVGDTLRFPTLDQIHRSSHHQQLPLIQSGLTVLVEKHLVAVCHWDGMQGDYSNLQNRWKQLF